MQPTNPQIYLTTRQAAEILHMSHRSLEALRMKGGGPRYRKASRKCLYARSDIDTWLEGRTFDHTAQARQAGVV